METYMLVIAADITFIIFAFSINKKNAKYFLAGYNTMSEKERDSIDNYVIFLKKFFIILAIASSFLFVLMNYFIYPETSVTGYSIFISIMIFWLVFKANNYKKL